MLKELIEKVLNDYLKAKTDNYSDHELAKYIRKDIPEFLENITENSYLYLFDGSAGRGTWANCPWVAILDKKITKSVQSGYFPVYLFREDMQGVYLSLMFGTGDFKSKYGDKTKAELVSHASKCREKHPNLNNTFDETDIDLATDSPNSLASFYEAGNIAAKYYDINELPTEEELEADYWEIINIYNQITGTKPVGIREFIKKVLENYLLAKNNPKLAKELVTFANGGDFHKYLIEIADQSGNGDYETYGDFGSSENLIWLPFVQIYGKFASRFHIRFTFREDMKGVYLSINQAPWTMDSRLKKRSLNIPKFSKEFQNHLKEEASEARSKLNRLTKIPDKFTGKIDLGSENATAGPSIEAGNVYAKCYTLNNLPSEKDLVSDYKEFLRIYELLESKSVIDEPLENPGKSGGIITETMTFFEDLSKKGYFFDHQIVENFLLSLKVKPFVILTGNSGTGKTKVAQLFAQYLSNSEKSKDSSFLTEVKVGQSASSGGWALNKAKFSEFSPALKENEITYDIKVDNIKGKGTLTPWPYLFFDKTEGNIKKKLEELNPEKKVNLEIIIPRNNESKYEIIPVGANWTENRHILGFYNVITEKYQKTKALNLIINAFNEFEVLQEQSEPYFLILDEMNLSHVERYFSDFLSAMESEEEIEVHQATIDEETPYEPNNLPPQKIKISKNLMVIGTVNVDETTYMFSPKVLDRANTLEFLTQPAEDYMSGTPEYSVKGDLNYLQNPLSDINIRNENINELKNRLIGVKAIDGQDIWNLLSKNIGQFQEILKKADFDFGFRSINEIIRFMCVAWQYEEKPLEWNNWERYFDAQIMQKMLPKLHGSQKELSSVLDELEDLCITGNFPSAADKLKKMRKTLKEKRYVAFTG
ncbi:MAG: MrcB family domain-containing protein [Methanobacterium sp.]